MAAVQPPMEGDPVPYSLLDQAVASGPARRVAAPYLIVVTALTVVVGASWVGALALGGNSSSTVACTSDTLSQSDAPGRVHSPDYLDSETPVSPVQVQLRVLNANGQAGQAAETAAVFGELGFGSPAGDTVGNDPVYLAQDLSCHGQLRFGSAGMSTAATVALAAPCLELVEDDRSDSSVDVALGSYFRVSSPSGQLREVMAQLQDGQAPDPATLALLRDQTC